MADTVTKGMLTPVAVARIIHEHFYCNLRSAATTALGQRARLAEAPPDLFRPTIRVPLRASQADFKRGNAK